MLSYLRFHPFSVAALSFCLIFFALPALSQDMAEWRVSRRGLEDLIIPRKPLKKSLLGINAFVNDQRFGGIRSQFREVRSKLGLSKVRVLFAWNDAIQASPSSAPFFNFYDEIVNSLPPDTEAIAVLTGLPSWMKNSANWIDGNPRRTVAEKWVRVVAARYASKRRLTGFQLWNEPNDRANPDNSTLDFVNAPDNYLEFLAYASDAVKTAAPRKLVLNAATTAINQNYPSTLDYNRTLVAGGALDFVHAYAVHVYGKNLERFFLPGGVGDFLKDIRTRPIWVTESGAQGVLKQRDYAQRMFPFLTSTFPNIKRIYIYQFTDSAPVGTTYGLRTPSRSNPVSDLYVYLRDGR